jgi:NAD(P)-dependent dehydrogenase (short-subunit alcohol dehydrogenase family)
MDAQRASGARDRRFEGQVAIVTGAGSGIGAATASRLAREGAAVALVGRERGPLDEVAAAITSAGGVGDVLPLDVRDEAAVAAAVDRVLDRHARIDVVVSNAGIGRRGAVETQPANELRDLLSTHVEALWALCRGVVPAMRVQGHGSVVAVTSVHAFATLPLLGAYAASKTAILGAVRGLALDLAGDGIRVNAVAPGSVDTPMLRSSAERRDAADPASVIRDWGERHPIGRVIRADEVAAAIAFLCSDEASAITGACLPVDGGLLARLAL